MTEEKTNEEEMTEIDVWEFSLDNEEIDELVSELNKLKDHRTNFSFDIDEDNELLVHHADNEDLEDEE